MKVRGSLVVTGTFAEECTSREGRGLSVSERLADHEGGLLLARLFVVASGYLLNDGQPRAGETDLDPAP